MKKNIPAAAAGAAPTNAGPEALPAPATGAVKEGFVRVEILHDTAIGADRVRAGQVVDAPAHDASHLLMIGKAKLPA